MSNEPIDKYFGVPMSEWIERIPNELEVDAVGMWQIVPVGKDSFGLSDDGLRSFVKRSIMELLNRGAVPVRPSSEQNKFWEKQLQYGNNKEEIVNNILLEWEASKVDPDENGLWFALMD